MDTSPVPGDEDVSEHHIVKADEMDQTGTDISTVSDDQLMAEVAEGLKEEVSQGAKDPEESTRSSGSAKTASASRPELRRDSSAPPPPLQPPPPAPVQQNREQRTDSLSLGQLRRIVQELPKIEQPAYAFEYADSQPFPDELDEWFQYSEPDRIMLLGTKVSFEYNWKSFCARNTDSTGENSWLSASRDLRKSFIEKMLDGFHNSDLFARIESLEAVCYAMLGVWGLTAGRVADDYPDEPTPHEATETPRTKSMQIKWIEENVLLVEECNGIPALYEYMRKVFDKDKTSTIGVELNDVDNENSTSAYFAAQEREANLVLTALYLVVEVGRRLETSNPQQTALRNAIKNLTPDLLVFLVEIISRLRWDDSTSIPLTRVILLFWKSLLLLFGGSQNLQRAKEVLEPPLQTEDDGSHLPFLTASPLDYHSFRQEITSKYPAYNPPQPVVPFELDNSSILPPLPQHPSRIGSSSSLFSGVGPSTAGGNGSILHQSVHIATPAPSPPPSPAGPGGKAAKKQNYQTNQNFPFMYPPLDGSSNNIGGKGTSGLQDQLVGKRWEGSDVPASIIEAGKLFSSHVKMTRAMRQLWEERERFMKYDRGWNAEDLTGQPEPQLEDEPEEFSLEPREKEQEKAPSPVQQYEKETDDEEVQRRLDAVETFYKQAMPNLQSVVIVFLKVILTNVSVMVNQANGQNGFPSGQNGLSPELDSDAAIEELDNLRLREITGKGVSGSLLLMLKWFKRSHILKFEYMTQLLLDSNYLPLILKMFAHQDVDQAVAQPNDREDLSFFHFCHVHSDQPPEHPPSSDAESSHSEDEAVPPPIRRQPVTQSFQGSSSVRGPSPEKFSEVSEGPFRPEVDELGYPLAPPPKEPITTYSFRNFFSAINYLHIMQKITRDKAHRCLLLVQYKSSTILRKGLKIPDPHLRLYTLKLFKSQVPYCGRKWRQSNMRVITAIYLYCRPDLRDDWLAGSDIDAEVEDALPLEQALRGLTHWWHLRRYKDVMGGDEGATIMDEERDFFVRELEAMGWGLMGDEMLSSMADEGSIPGPGINGTEWDGVPLQMESW
ncbi:pheromone-dependent cell cycle arrest protein Far11, putative [Paecilomyces variotii No. 5]|uniref:Pheromone-dependent cell cycle arrest protein Far11, putative n=1 Tax=Byssochlamys spectabilis (strain No. 5 / NBRC 109023) TaxID=1356009 RepID=V5F702_BYSSN|nr:pheromone-dependent cell cycle arrest protein Far11, putative [Paecilomyces variotii No. 5]